MYLDPIPMYLDLNILSGSIYIYILQFHPFTPSTHQQLIAAAGAAAGHCPLLPGRGALHGGGSSGRKGRKGSWSVWRCCWFLKSIGPNHVFRAVPAMGKSLAELLAAKRDRKVKVVQSLSWFYFLASICLTTNTIYSSQHVKAAAKEALWGKDQEAPCSKFCWDPTCTAPDTGLDFSGTKGTNRTLLWFFAHSLLFRSGFHLGLRKLTTPYPQPSAPAQLGQPSSKQ